MPTELAEIERAIPFQVNGDGALDDSPGGGYIMLHWLAQNANEAPPYWSRARDKWLRNFARTNGPIKNAVNTFVNKLVTIPFTVEPRDRSIARHVRNAHLIEEVLRRNSGSMSSGPLKGFKHTLKMFVNDFLTQDNGGFMQVLGNGPAEGPIVGAPMGLLHLDAALCTRTRDAEYPVKYLNAGRGGDNKEYNIHYTRLIEMVNLPSPDVDLNGIGLCPVSCCLEAAQELHDIYQYSREMFGSAPPQQILYAKKGATLKTMTDAIAAWRQKLESENRERFGGTLIMAPAARTGVGQEMELDVLELTRQPEDFSRRDVTTIDKSEIAAAFGLDLRDLSYTLGAPSRTGDAEVQDRKGRGKGVGEFIETFVERMEENYLNKTLFHLRFDNQDDEQDEQRAAIRDKRSTGRERDLRAGVTTIRVERERMWEEGEITYEQFAQMELEDGRLPEGLDVLLLFQSQDAEFQDWLDLGVSDPTDIAANDPMTMADTIHDKYIEVSRIIHEETRAERRRKARQALAALDKLRSMYQVPEGQAIGEQATVEAMDEGATDLGESQPADSPEPPANEATDVVKSLHTKQLEDIDVDLAQYDTQFRLLLQQALNGEISQERFEGAIEQIVVAILLSMFLRGSRRTYGELPADALADLNNEIDTHLQSLEGFSNDIYVNRLYTTEARGVENAMMRLGTWITIAAGVYFLGQLWRADEPYLRWDYAIFKEHCADCARLNGQVHTASEWRASGWRPRSFTLECRGLHCGCSFTQVEGPSTGAF